MHAGQATLVPVRGAWCRRRVADVQDLQAALRFERLDGVVLVGHSCGGMVMTQVADRTPERIRALVYVDAMLGAVIHPAADDGNPDVPLSWASASWLWCPACSPASRWPLTWWSRRTPLFSGCQ